MSETLMAAEIQPGFDPKTSSNGDGAEVTTRGCLYFPAFISVSSRQSAVQKCVASTSSILLTSRSGHRKPSQIHVLHVVVRTSFVVDPEI